MWSLINVSSNLHIQLMLNSMVYNFLASLSSFGGIPSTPGYLLSFIFLMFFYIISGVTNNCPKCSDLLPSNLVNGNGSELISSVVNVIFRLLASAFLFCRQPSPYVDSLSLSATFMFCHFVSVGSLFLLPAAFSFNWQPTSYVGSLLLLLAAYFFCRHPSPSVGNLLLACFSFCQPPSPSISSLLLLLSADFSFC